VWAWDAADHCRHHPSRGHPQDSTPSHARRRADADRPGAGLPRPLRMDLALTRQRLFPRSLETGRGRGAPAPRHAGRLRRARAREKRLAEQTEGFSGSEGWFLPPRRSLAGRVPGADGWTPSKRCFKIPLRIRRLAVRRCYGLLLSPGAAAIAASQGWPLAQACGRGGGAKMPFICPIHLLQALGLFLCVLFSEIVLWLPRIVYGN
jgi:hypothetical protein